MASPPPRDERPTREQVSAWLDEHPDASGADVARVWGLAASTARRWVSAHRKRSRPPAVNKAGRTVKGADGKDNAPARARPSRARAKAPVESMAPADRDRVVGIVRDVHTTLALLAAATRKRIEAAVQGDADADGEDELPLLDRDTAQAALNLQRMAASLIESHPGLLQLATADEKGQGKGVEDDDLEGVLEAIGAGPPRG